MRVRVQVNEMWQSSDPRRLSAFKVLEVHRQDGYVIVQNVYPRPGVLRSIKIENFMLLGPKGYCKM